MSKLHKISSIAEGELIKVRYDDRTVYLMDDRAHRSNGPAIVLDNGHWCWKLFGEYHRYYGIYEPRHGWSIHGQFKKES